METLRRIYDTLFPLLIAGLLVLVATPAKKMPEGSGVRELREHIAKNYFMPMGLSQQWGMYAPDPARSMSYVHLTAESKGARVFPVRKSDPQPEPGSAPEGTWQLDEARWAEQDWGVKWFWHKSRADIWRYRLAMSKHDTPNRNRSWYMRGVCVREAREGRFPHYIQMQALKRRFSKPEAVRKGKPEYGPREYIRSDRTWCKSKLVAGMLEHDRLVNPEAYR